MQQTERKKKRGHKEKTKKKRKQKTKDEKKRKGTSVEFLLLVSILLQLNVFESHRQVEKNHTTSKNNY